MARVVETFNQKSRPFPIADGVSLQDGWLVGLNSSRRLVKVAVDSLIEPIGILWIKNRGHKGNVLTGNAPGTVLGDVIRDARVYYSEIVSQTIGADVYAGQDGANGIPVTTLPSAPSDIYPIGFVDNSDAAGTMMDLSVRPSGLARQTAANTTVAFG